MSEITLGEIHRTLQALVQRGAHPGSIEWVLTQQILWPEGEESAGSAAIRQVRAAKKETQQWRDLALKTHDCAEEFGRHGECICSYDGPEEFCPRDGRPYVELVEKLATQAEEIQRLRCEYEPTAPAKFASPGVDLTVTPPAIWTSPDGLG